MCTPIAIGGADFKCADVGCGDFSFSLKIIAFTEILETKSGTIWQINYLEAVLL